MPSWADLAGAGSVAEQLLVWGVLNQLLGVFFGPTIDLIQQKVNAGHPVAELSPADLASAVVRNFMSEPDAIAAAARDGIDADRFRVMVALSGDAPGPSELAEALRRGIITEDGGPASTAFTQGIAEGRLADKWAPVIKALATYWPSPSDILDAALQGQIPAGESAVDLYRKVGGDPQWYQLLFDAKGSAPTPMEALEMLNRGIIPESGTGPGATSYEQAFLEGPWRDKWLPAFRELGRYIPPPRTVTALIHDGVLSDAEALALFQKTGMSADLAAKYVASAHATKTAHAKEISESIVLTLYEAHGIDTATATAHLEALGYTPADIGLILEAIDLRREASAVASAVTRVGTLYITRKITRRGASDALDALSVTVAHRDHLLSTWDAERAANVKQLTPAQIVDAWEYQNITEAEALAELENLGYTPLDAWILLSNKAKAPLPNKPPAGPGGPGVNP